MLHHIFSATTLAVALLGNCQSANAQKPNADGTYYGRDVIFWEGGVGINFSQSNSTGNFFGPGTGNGLLLTNDSWSASSFVFSGGLYRTFGPWYGGINVNVITPSINSQTVSGITSNGIPVTSIVEQSGLGVEMMARFGYNTFPSPVRFFIEGGVNVTNYNGTITAPTVGDFFNGSKTLISPVVGAGLNFNLCPFVGAPTQGLCPHLELEGTHVFGNQSWLLETTPLSSGEASQRGTTRVSAKVVFPFSIVDVGTRTAWTPVKDLTFAAEHIYNRQIANRSGQYTDPWK